MRLSHGVTLAALKRVLPKHRKPKAAAAWVMSSCADRRRVPDGKLRVAVQRNDLASPAGCRLAQEGTAWPISKSFI